MRSYDYAILGGGAAGLSLALALARSPLGDRSILIVEKDAKDRNDRTWCFWSDRPLPLDPVRGHAWENLRFLSEGVDLTLPLEPFRYQMVRGIDFYRYAHQELEACPNVTIVRAAAGPVEDGEDAAWVSVNGDRCQAAWVFDSRIDGRNFQGASRRYHQLLQHFRGWELSTRADYFDPATATLFDLRTPQDNGVCFFYVLPTGPRKALVEYTLFSASLLEEAAYDRALKGYIESQLGIEAYQVEGIEKGAIPMTDRPFPRRIGKRILAIGTLGGRVKPSTGYAFARIQRDSGAIVRSLLRRGDPFGIPAGSPRHRFYDSLMLDVMACEGTQVKQVLSALFARNPTGRVLRFLDDQASPWEELQVIASLPSRPFLKALFRTVKRRAG